MKRKVNKKNKGQNFLPYVLSFSLGLYHIFGGRSDGQVSFSVRNGSNTTIGSGCCGTGTGSRCIDAVDDRFCGTQNPYSVSAVCCMLLVFICFAATNKQIMIFSEPWSATIQTRSPRTYRRGTYSYSSLLKGCPESTQTLRNAVVGREKKKLNQDSNFATYHWLQTIGQILISYNCIMYYIHTIYQIIIQMFNDKN